MRYFALVLVAAGTAFGQALPPPSDLLIPSLPQIPSLAELEAKPFPPRVPRATLPERAVWRSDSHGMPFTQDDIRSVAFSPDGRLVASSSRTSAELWDVGTGTLIRQFLGHTEFVNSVAFSPDGKTLATASFDKTVRYWDVGTGQERFRSTGHEQGITFVTYSRDGTLVASGAYDNTVRIWDAASGKNRHVFTGATGPILGLAFSPDGQTIAACGCETPIRRWSLATAKELPALEGSPANVRSIVFSPDGKELFSSCCDSSIRQWDLATAKAVKVCSGHTDDVFALDLSSDGKMLVAACHDTTISIWDATIGWQVRAFPAHAGGAMCLNLSPDGRTIVSGGYDKSIRLWDVATGRERLTFGGASVSHVGPANAIAFSERGELIASAGSDGTIVVRDARTGVVARTLIAHGIVQPNSSGAAPRTVVSDLAFLPGGTKLASVGLDGYLRTWDITTGKQIHFVGVPDSPLYAVACIGKTIAYAGRDGKVRVCNADGLDKTVILEGHSGPVISLAFSRTGDVLASASHDRTARLWDIAARKQLKLFAGHDRALSGLAIAPDGKTLATASFDKTIRTWDVEKGTEQIAARRRLARPGPLAFSPDGKRLALSADDEVFVRDLESGKDAFAFEPEGDRVTGLAFAPDGQTIASTTVDGTVMLWHVGPGKFAPAGPVESVLAIWWADLAGDDMARVHRAIWGFASHPVEAAAFLKTRTVPASGPGRAKIAKWLAELDHDRYVVREAAMTELQKLGPIILPTLQKHRDAKLSPEARERLDKLIAKLASEPLSPDELRASSVVEVLELIANRTELERLKTGDPDSTLTLRANAALERLARRK